MILKCFLLQDFLWQHYIKSTSLIENGGEGSAELNKAVVSKSCCLLALSHQNKLTINLSMEKEVFLSIFFLFQMEEEIHDSSWLLYFFFF